MSGNCFLTRERRAEAEDEESEDRAKVYWAFQRCDLFFPRPRITGKAEGELTS